MTQTPSPPSPTHPDRFLRCQEALDDAFATAVEAAVEAGWHPEEVAAAMVEIADNHMLSVLANRGLERDLAILKKRRL
jgi:hypothetical protein